MLVISSAEFATNQQKYFDLALKEKVFVRNGGNTYRIIYEPEYIEPQKILEPDEDLSNAITKDELLKGVYQDLETFFADK